MWLIRKILFPVSLVYALVVWIRNQFYNLGWFKSKSFSTPLVCVGNLSVGGTGKTPMIEFLVNGLQDQFKLAVLSRGYRRQSKGYVQATDKTLVTQLGDEPFQLHKKFKNLIVAVDADRQNGIQQLASTVKPELILLDDAFQHRKVTPSFSILLTTYENPFISDWYLPTGNLRDSKVAAKRADCIVVTKCPNNLAPKARKEIEKRLKKHPKQHVFFSYLTYENSVFSNTDKFAFKDLRKKQITLVTGIANPKPLVAYLKTQDIQFEHLAYKDHHNFTALELKELAKRQFILTTEKDYVRLEGKLDTLYYLPVRHQFFDDGGEALLKLVKARI